MALHPTYDALLERSDLDAVLIFADNRTAAELGAGARARPPGAGREAEAADLRRGGPARRRARQRAPLWSTGRRPGGLPSATGSPSCWQGVWGSPAAQSPGGHAGPRSSAARRSPAGQNHAIVACPPALHDAPLLELDGHREVATRRNRVDRGPCDHPRGVDARRGEEQAPGSPSTMALQQVDVEGLSVPGVGREAVRGPVECLREPVLKGDANPDWRPYAGRRVGESDAGMDRDRAFLGVNCTSAKESPEKQEACGRQPTKGRHQAIGPIARSSGSHGGRRT